MAMSRMIRIVVIGISASAVLAGSASVIIWIVLPSTWQREDARNSAAASNMNQIGKAMFMYAEENGGKFPAGGGTSTESLWLLYPKYASDPKLFLNPNEKMRAPDVAPLTNDSHKSRIAAEWLSATGFIYLEGVAADDAAEMLLFERMANRGGRNVLIGAGTVEFQHEDDFQKLWKARQLKSNAAPAAATPPSSNP